MGGVYLAAKYAYFCVVIGISGESFVISVRQDPGLDP